VPQILNIAHEKACNMGMTYKDTQGHYVQLLLLDEPYMSIWPVVTTSLSSTVSKILSLFQCM